MPETRHYSEVNTSSRFPVMPLLIVLLLLIVIGQGIAVWQLRRECVSLRQARQVVEDERDQLLVRLGESEEAHAKAIAGRDALDADEQVLRNTVENLTRQVKDLQAAAAARAAEPMAIEPRTALPVPSWAPRPRPFNGQILANFPTAGPGVLVVNNGNDRDAVVKLVDFRTGQAIAGFYVQAGSSAPLTGVPDGSYAVVFALGDEFDPATGGFTRAKSFARLDRALTFQTSSWSDGVRVWTNSARNELTLHAVVGGNTTRSSVGEEEFLRY